MNTAMISSRQTKYCTAIKDALTSSGHATNSELLEYLRITFPKLSATTVHRATARLYERGEIAIAPTKFGSMRYDANTTPHDHFECSQCGNVRDADIKDQVTPIIEDFINDCHINGRLTISGVCNKCTKGNK